MYRREDELLCWVFVTFSRVWPSSGQPALHQRDDQHWTGQQRWELARRWHYIKGRIKNILFMDRNYLVLNIQYISPNVWEYTSWPSAIHDLLYIISCFTLTWKLLFYSTSTATTALFLAVGLLWHIICLYFFVTYSVNIWPLLHILSCHFLLYFLISCIY